MSEDVFQTDYFWVNWNLPKNLFERNFFDLQWMNFSNHSSSEKSCRVLKIFINNFIFYCDLRQSKYQRREKIFPAWLKYILLYLWVNCTNYFEYSTRKLLLNSMGERNKMKRLNFERTTVKIQLNTINTITDWYTSLYFWITFITLLQPLIL